MEKSEVRWKIWTSASIGDSVRKTGVSCDGLTHVSRLQIDGCRCTKIEFDLEGTFVHQEDLLALSDAIKIMAMTLPRKKPVRQKDDVSN